jgi:hypothetical protein
MRKTNTPCYHHYIFHFFHSVVIILLEARWNEVLEENLCSIACDYYYRLDGSCYCVAGRVYAKETRNRGIAGLASVRRSFVGDDLFRFDTVWRDERFIVYCDPSTKSSNFSRVLIDCDIMLCMLLLQCYSNNSINLFTHHIIITITTYLSIKSLHHKQRRKKLVTINHRPES